MPYGQNQSFYLRDRWISKALKGVNENERFLFDDDSFEQVGLGKNMVQSLKFWAEATKIVEKNIEKKHYHTISKLGNLIFKYDRVIQINDTASILHYHLVSDDSIGTSYYWFFNIYNERTATKEEILKELSEWVERTEQKSIAEGSLIKDINAIIKLYTSGQDNDDPEEIYHSPLSKINILNETNGIIYKNTPEISDIGLTALMYVLLDYCQEKGIRTINVSEIERNDKLWGKVFNLNRSLIVSALDKLSKHKKYPVRFIRTNRLDDVQVPEIQAIDFLEYEYKLLEAELNVNI